MKKTIRIICGFIFLTSTPVLAETTLKLNCKKKSLFLTHYIELNVRINGEYMSGIKISSYDNFAPGDSQLEPIKRTGQAFEKTEELQDSIIMTQPHLSSDYVTLPQRVIIENHDGYYSVVVRGGSTPYGRIKFNKCHTDGFHW